MFFIAQADRQTHGQLKTIVRNLTKKEVFNIKYLQLQLFIVFDFTSVNVIDLSPSFPYKHMEHLQFLIRIIFLFTTNLN